MATIGIIDYGVGNLHSLKKAFGFFGVEPVITEDAERITEAHALVLPGVGSFEAGMRGLKARGLVEAVKNAGDRGTPMLGICLGAQLLLDTGYEFGTHKGLSLIPGTVQRFPLQGFPEKVPHVGWNKVFAQDRSWKGTIFEGLSPFEAYFVHSYVLVPDNLEDTLGVTEYGGVRFCSALKRGNIYATQFHPEKSGKEGLSIIKNFIDIARHAGKA